MCISLFILKLLRQLINPRRGRKVKPSGKGPQSKTLFDGEWLEGQKRALILLHPHSKIILEEGISSDADFLAQSNIMDYSYVLRSFSSQTLTIKHSLLLGVDSEQRHLACGLVDTIG
jgi:1-phosphatidylinositol-3-phosphate 5-kinase